MTKDVTEKIKDVFLTPCNLEEVCKMTGEEYGIMPVDGKPGHLSLESGYHYSLSGEEALKEKLQEMGAEGGIRYSESHTDDSTFGHSYFVKAVPVKRYKGGKE